ncbi:MULTISPECIES: hypothetical protein [Nocardia]|uniref:hypothetical protein n=1 Tax=Nocardia abscessus TaxID=120957 RepID=UPI001894E994|nr:hypothetical protein [Nocardia abscessus]MBF6472276.1 hypothetical protein [Nocardia abscessus]
MIIGSPEFVARHRSGTREASMRASEIDSAPLRGFSVTLVVGGRIGVIPMELDDFATDTAREAAAPRILNT